jgi:hypothetical protein
MATTGIGAVHAFFEADTKGFDASVGQSTAQLKAAAAAAELAGEKIEATGQKFDRAAAMQERAAERARRAWQREVIEQERAAQRDAETSRAKELAALKADILSRSLETQGKAQEFVNQATGHSVPQMAAASAAVRALEGNMTHNIRAGERFLTNTLGLGPVLAKAFPVIGAVAMGAAVFKLGSDLADFGSQARDLAEDLGTSWMEGAILQLEGLDKKAKEVKENLAKTQQQTDDWISQQKDLQFAKIGMAFGPEEEASARAQAMQQQATALESMLPLKQDQLDIARKLSNPMTPNVGETREKQEAYNLPTAPPIAAQMAKQLEAEIRETRQQIVTLRAKATAEMLKVAQPKETSEAPKADPFAADREWLQRIQREFSTLQSINPMSEGQVLAFWNRALPQLDPNSPQFQEVLNRAAAAGQRVHEKLQEGLKRARKASEKIASEPTGKAGMTFGEGGTLGLYATGNEALLKAQASVKEMQASVNAEWQAAVDKLDLLHGKLTPLEAAMHAQAAHTDEYRLKIAALREQLQQLSDSDSLGAVLGGPEFQAKQLQIQNEIAKLEGQRRVQQLEDAQATLGQTWTGMVNGVWDELIRKSNESQKELQQIAAHFIDGVNSETAKAITGGHTNFSGVFRSASESLAKTGLEKLEGSLLKGFGLGTPKADGSESNPFHVVMAGGTGISSGMAELFKAKSPNVGGPAGQQLLKSGGKGLLGFLNDSDFFTKGFLGNFFGAGGKFGSLGHFAEGGPMPSNMPAIVGERGPEIFMPSTPGHVVPNHRLGELGGGGAVYNIDARNTDPALTAANVHFAIQAARSQATAHAMHMMADRQQRVPH